MKHLIGNIIRNVCAIGVVFAEALDPQPPVQDFTPTYSAVYYIDAYGNRSGPHRERSSYSQASPYPWGNSQSAFN